MATTFSPEEIQQLEVEMHHAFTDWGQSHEDKKGSGISLIEYNPVKFPEQSIEVGLTEAWHYPLPERLSMWGLQNLLLARAIGSRAAAASLVADFKSISPDIADMLDEGKNVALVPSHKHYADIGIGAGALAVAMGKTRYIEDNIYQSINKLMTREKYHGIRIARFTSATGKILWVIPHEGAKKWKVPNKAMYIAGKAAEAALRPELENPDKGVLFSVALTASSMVEVRDEQQKLTGYGFPNIPVSVGATLSSYDAVVPFAFDKNSSGRVSWEVGDLITPPPIAPDAKPKEAGLAFTDLTYFDLAERMERLLGYPVSYEPISEIGKTAVRRATSRGSYPEQ